MINRVISYGRMIKFSHTIFALPFAFSAIVLAQRNYSIILSDIIWIILAMIGARSAAMGFNRIVDFEFDAKNPRTSKREIPAGRLSTAHAKLFVMFFSALFVFASAMLGKLCFYLSLPVLAILFSYSYTKRFTSFSHIYLGFVISLAPAGAWIAVAKSFSWHIVFLCLSLMTYIAGFDIIYACQDADFDKKEGLFSIPSKFGVRKALSISSILHIISFCCLYSVHIAFNMGTIFLITMCIIGILLIIEHLLVRPNNLKNINIAFFHINSVISVLLFVGIALDELVMRWI